MAAAKLCLLNAQRKAAYDADLRTRVATAKHPPAARPRPIAAPPVVARAGAANVTVADADCPDAASLSEFALGKLDAPAADRVSRHLAACGDCRQKVADVSSDGFVDLLRAAVVTGEQPANPGRTFGDREAAGGLETTVDRAKSPRGVPGRKPSSTARHQPDLADHPDYEIVKELGHGGMGVVYLARNRLMDRLEVLKVLKTSLLERPGALERFQQEIRSAAKLSHINIVASYAVLRTGDSLVFAMEYVPGEDLAQVVHRRGPLRVANAAYYAHQAALGLQHAHEKGMVHRDIKPNNLMLAVDGKKHIVKILDFGLAKATSEKDAETGLTKSGQILGTPDYLAPEQSRDAQRADIRADIYSLGCTLYFLLSGTRPFPESSLYDVLDAHQKRDATPLDQVRPEVPPELAAVVAKMMAKTPADRYQTPHEVARALIPFFKPGQSAAAPPAKPRDEQEYPQYAMDNAAPSEQPTASESLAAPAAWPSPQMALPVSPLRAVPIAVPLSKSTFDTSIDFETPLSETEQELGPPMRRWRLYLATCLAALLLMLGVVLLVPTKDGVPPENGTNNQKDIAQSQADGFLPLFNGKDLTGWKPHPEQQGIWRVDEGVLIGSGEADSYLFTERANFTNFHLRVEARIKDHGDSGVYCRATFGSDLWPLGYEAEINTSEKESVTGSLFGWGSAGGSHASSRAVRPYEWFTLEVIVTDNHIVAKVNGQTTATYDDPDRRFPMGHIALEKYRPQTIVEFRKIELKEFQPAADAKPAGVPADAQEFGGHWYKFYQERLPWKWARDRCHSYAGHLVTIDSMAENDFVGGVVAQAAWQDAWIGATDEAEEGKWRSVDGELLHFTNWMPGQPNNQNKREHYALMTHRFTGGNTRWNWFWCDQPNESKESQPGFVCEWEPKAALTTASGVANGLKTTPDAPLPGGASNVDEASLPALPSNPPERFACEIPDGRGKWSIDGDELVQASLDPRIGILFGNGDWEDVDFSVEVQRTGGNGACELQLHFEDDANTIRYFAGGWGNTKHDVVRIKKGNHARMALQNGSLTTGKWYHLEARLRGNHGECFLDGERIMNFETDRGGRGRVGLVSSDSPYRYRNITVKAPDGKVLLQGLPDLTNASIDPPGSAKGAADAGRSPSAAQRFACEVPDAARGKWSIEGNVLVARPAVPGGKILFGDSNWTDYDLFFEAKVVRGWALRAVFRYQDDKNFHMYGVGAWTNNWQLVDTMENGTWGKRQCERPLSLAKQTWYRIQVEVRGQKGRCFLDGDSVSEFTVPHLSKGRVGLFVEDLASFQFRNIVAKAPDGTVLLDGLPDIDQAGTARRAATPSANGAKTVADENRRSTSVPGLDDPAFQQWLNEVSGMSPKAQVAAVEKRLRERNPGFKGKLQDTVQDGVVTGLTVSCTYVTDISPLRALTKLKSLTLNNNARTRAALTDLTPLAGMSLSHLVCWYANITDLSPLKGMPLTSMQLTWSEVNDLSPLMGMQLMRLGLQSTKVSDLTPLKGMPLQHLDVLGTKITDLSPLAEMPLVTLQCANTSISDLAPLRGLRLTSLTSGFTKISDLSPLAGMPLSFLSCDNTNVAELSPLKGMPLTGLQLTGSQVSDLSPLKGMPLTFLSINRTRVTDLSPLKDMPLITLNCDFQMERDSAVLGSINTLKKVNGMMPDKFWKKAGSRRK